MTSRDKELVGELVPVVHVYLAGRGFEAKAVLLPWSAAYRRTIAGPNALLYPVDRTAAREDQFHWIKPLITTSYYLYGLKDKVDPSASLADIVTSGAMISCTQNSIQCELLLQHGVPDTSILRIEGASIKRRFTLMVNERNYYSVFDPLVYDYLSKSQNFDASNLVQLQKLGEMTSYLAASKAMQDDLLMRLR
ncbi:MAG: hypothetical protein EP335_01465 [Alphaproteobacteria bacterium]|nr:MAG: hypothetical protein EP335_01465 [Alphaproteobacteria bacterium]